MLLVAAASSAYTFAARPQSGQKVSGQAVSGKPPAGLQRAADQLVADGVPGVIIMTRRGHGSRPVGRPRRQGHGQPCNRRAGCTSAASPRPLSPLSCCSWRLRGGWAGQQRGEVAAGGYRRPRLRSRADYLPPAAAADQRDPRLPGRPGFQTVQGLGETWQPRQLVGIALRLGPPVHGWLYRRPTTSCSG